MTIIKSKTKKPSTNKTKKTVSKSSAQKNPLAKISANAKKKALVAKKQLIKVSSAAKSNAGKYIDIGKLKAKNMTLNNKINKSFEKIGKIVYDEKINIDNQQIYNNIKDIDTLKSQLKNIQNSNKGE